MICKEIGSRETVEVICHYLQFMIEGNRMKAIMALLALFMVAPCLAEQQTVTTGPYEISFDLGIPKASYSVNISSPQTAYSPVPRGTRSYIGNGMYAFEQRYTTMELDHTTYQINLTNNTNAERFITIILKEYRRDQVSYSPNELASIAKSLMEQMPKVRDVQESGRMISGANGGMASGKIDVGYGLNQDIYLVIYIPDARLVVSMVSTYPWDGGTHQLLKTIYVQKTA
jgi:hypothetical protein